MINWPEQLINDLMSKRTVLFLGSGVSRNSVGIDGKTRPQTWAKFLETASKKINVFEKTSTYLDKHDHLTALDIIQNSCSPDEYANIITQEYLTPQYGHAPIHEEIYKLDAPIVLTPNFDKIYDVYAQSISRGTTIVKQYFDLDLARFIRGDKRVVIKIHGSVDSVPNMIFGRKDYAASRVKHSWFYEILKSLILTHTFLFIGCGTDDPDIRLLLEDVNFSAGFSREHYFLSAKESIQEEFSTILKDTMNLRVLEYDYDPAQDDHSDLSASIKALADQLPWNC